MRLHLFWIDKRWKEKGMAENYNLLVDIDNKTYKIYLNGYYAYRMPEDIEVKKKSDIMGYVEYLKENGFNEVKHFYY